MNAIRLIDKFAPIKYDKSRYFVVTGGRGSSKSYSVTTILVGMLIEEANQVILFTRYTLTSAHISIIPEFIEKIKLLGVENRFQITKTEITCDNGSRIIFRGIQTSSGNQTANLKSIQGVTTWVLDEAEELSDETIFDKIDESIRAKSTQNRIILILNPVTSNHWIYRRFYENGKQSNTTYIHTTYLDNKENLSDSFIDKAEQLKQANYEKYKHRFLGAWLESADGVVFENWTEGTQPDIDLPVVFGQDYGFSNDPTTLVRCAFDTKNMKIYLKELCYKSGLATKQIEQINKTYAAGFKIIGDSAEPRLIDELKRSGINIEPATKGQGSVSAGLLGLQDWQLIVDPESYNLKKELRNYVWIDKGSKLVIDDYNHLIDPIRYAFQYFTKPKITNFVV